MRPVSFVVLLALTLAGSAIAAGPVTFSLPRPIVWFDAARPELDITIDAKVPAGATPPRSEPAEKEPATPPEELPTVADVTPAPAAGTAAIAVKAVEVRAVPLADKTMRRWRVRAVVPTYPAGVNTLERKLRVTWGSYISPDLTYWLTSATAASLNWKVIGLPTEWSAKGPWCLPMRLAVGGQRATGILVTSRLVEQSTKRPMAPRLFLSLDDKKPAEAASRALETAVNDRGETVYLCADAGAMPGKYQGSITISSAEKPDAEALAATVYTTTNGAISLGIVLLAFGSVLAFFARVLAPARLQRSQALLPAALVRERAAKVAARLTDVVRGAAFLPSATLDALKTFNTDLDDRVLEAANMVPKGIPSPFVFALDTAGYRALLDKATERLGKLDVLVDGFARAMKLGADAARLSACLTALDELAHSIDQQTLEQVRTAVEARLLPLRPTDPADATLALSGPPVRDTETLLLDIRWTSGVVWLTATALTFIVGLFYLVLQNPAFGVPMDFLFCFGWGFGLPTAAGQLTGASAREALGVTLPKVSA